jgi:hypothetical protein
MRKGELTRGQVRILVEEFIRLRRRLCPGYDAPFSLEDLYLYAKVVIGRDLTTREKQRVAGYVSKRYPISRVKGSRKTVYAVF